MSLLDAFLEDGLAASVLEKSDVWFAIRKDGAVGSGSKEDPFDGSTAAHFDAAMADEDLVGENTTIHLGPGEFKTAGGTAWQPRSGQRIVGAGINATTLKVENSETGIVVVAIGNPATDPNYDPEPIVALEGFEVSDLTIDCGFTAQSNPDGIGGVSVTGRNVFLRRIAVKDFGAKSESQALGLSAAWATAAHAPSNCVIEACQVVPAEAGEGIMICLRLGSAGGDAKWHSGCEIRDCVVDGAVEGGEADFDRDIRGVVASGGAGTIIEGNRIRNCRHGGPCQVAGEATVSTQDLIVRDNAYARVQYGISMGLASPQTVQRLVALDNWIELGTDDQESWNISGIQLKRSSGVGFTNVILRGNVIRCDGGQYDPEGDYGIELQGCAHAIVQNNLIDIEVANNAVSHPSTDGVTLFNNQTADGEFRPGFDGTLHDQELTTEVEDVLLGLVMRGGG